MNELMFVADLLVTDYSSAIFEFALLGRPMAFLAPDADAYERERGFYLDFRRDMPGPIFADDRGAGGVDRGGRPRPGAVRRLRARRASTWPTAGRASGSWTRWCCRRCGPAGSTWRRSAPRAARTRRSG